MKGQCTGVVECPGKGKGQKVQIVVSMLYDSRDLSQLENRICTPFYHKAYGKNVSGTRPFVKGQMPRQIIVLERDYSDRSMPMGLMRCPTPKGK